MVIPVIFAVSPESRTCAFDAVPQRPLPFVKNAKISSIQSDATNLNDRDAAHDRKRQRCHVKRGEPRQSTAWLRRMKLGMTTGENTAGTFGALAQRALPGEGTARERRRDWRTPKGETTASGAPIVFGMGIEVAGCHRSVTELRRICGRTFARRCASLGAWRAVGLRSSRRSSWSTGNCSSRFIDCCSRPWRNAGCRRPGTIRSGC